MDNLEKNLNDAADAAKDAASDIVSDVSGAASNAASDAKDAMSGAAKSAGSVLNNAAASVSSTDNNKLFGALTYPLPIIGIIALVSDSMKNDPVLRKHSVQSLAYFVVSLIVSFILGITVIGSCLVIFLIVPPILWAIQAYQGKDVNIPVITDFCKKQGWF